MYDKQRKKEELSEWQRKDKAVGKEIVKVKDKRNKAMSKPKEKAKDKQRTKRRTNKGQREEQMEIDKAEEKT